MTALGGRISTKSERQRELESAHRRSRAAVMNRCRGVCEAFDCSNAAKDWAHAFGRRHIISEPWCSTPELTFGLYREHHNLVDRGLDLVLRRGLQWLALTRFATAYAIPSAVSAGLIDPVDVARSFDRYMAGRTS